MRVRKVLLLLTAVTAVIGFVLVLTGSQDSGPPAGDEYGWFAYAPDTSDAYSSTLTVELDDQAGLSSQGLVGLGLIGVSMLLTAGIIGQWWIAARHERSVE